MEAEGWHPSKAPHGSHVFWPCEAHLHGVALAHVHGHTHGLAVCIRLSVLPLLAGALQEGCDAAAQPAGRAGSGQGAGMQLAIAHPGMPLTITAACTGIARHGAATCVSVKKGRVPGVRRRRSAAVGGRQPSSRACGAAHIRVPATHFLHMCTCGRAAALEALQGRTTAP